MLRNNVKNTLAQRLEAKCGVWGRAPDKIALTDKKMKMCLIFIDKFRFLPFFGQ